MSNYEAVLNFERYFVEEMNYVQNELFSFDDELETLNVEFDIAANIRIYSENKESVTLTVECGNLQKSDCPFFLRVQITGIYSFAGNNEDIEDFLKQSGVAILFPYARSLVSDLTGRSNLFPQYNLPLINVPMMLEKNDKISIEYID
ncbi:MAG: protein-export chaperone SecB [Atopostipes sp.]|nr:protein-export chaperone SecB [Atopostipes sp.]